MTLQLY